MESTKKSGRTFSFERFTRKKKKTKKHSLDQQVGSSEPDLRAGWNLKIKPSKQLSTTNIPATFLSEKNKMYQKPDSPVQKQKFLPGPVLPEGEAQSEFTVDDGGSMCLWADTMSKEQITECKVAFAHFDKNGDGRISWKDFGKILRHLGQNPTEKELEDIRVDRILQSGTNGTAPIDFPEFITVIAKRFGVDGAEDMERAFRAFDENGDGLISFAEFKAYNQKIGQFLSDEEIEEFIKEVDIDGDGFLNYEEFVRMNMR